MSQLVIALAMKTTARTAIAARERERVGADEPVLDAAELDRAEAEAARDLADRAGDQRLLDEAPRARARAQVGRLVEDRVVELVEENFSSRIDHGFGTRPPLAHVEEPGDVDAGERRGRPRRPTRSAPACRSPRSAARRPGRASVVIGSQNGANWIKPANVREHGEHADRPDHRERPLEPAVLLVQVLAAANVRLLAAEDDEVEPERVEAGQERAREAGDEEEVAELAAAVERRRDDRVLREEAGERRRCRRAPASRPGTPTSCAAAPARGRPCGGCPARPRARG